MLSHKSPWEKIAYFIRISGLAGANGSNGNGQTASKKDSVL